MSEINVTPFVDVMLVLLVVFMITAPLLTTGVSVNLPRTNTPAVAGQDEPLSVTVSESGEVFIQETATPIDELTNKLTAITEARGDRNVRVFVRGDSTIDYGIVMAAIAAIRAAGLTNIALITDSASTS